MRKLDRNLNTLDIVCKLMSMLVLKLYWNIHGRSKREAHGLINVLCCQVVDICDKHVKHDHLVAESLILLYNHSDLTLLVECANPFIIDESDYR